ncbi:MAG: hypothetical protein MHM6MM_006319 [Cercozoa sp. M6MM]
MYEHLATVFSELLPSMLPLMCGEIDAMRFALLHKSLPTHFECEVVVKVRRMVFYGREERYSSTMHVEGTPDETISAVGLYFPRIDERLLGGILDLEKRRGVHYLVQGGDARIETDMGVAFANWAGPHRLSGVRPVANFSDRTRSHRCTLRGTGLCFQGVREMWLPSLCDESSSATRCRCCLRYRTFQ